MLKNRLIRSALALSLIAAVALLGFRAAGGSGTPAAEAANPFEIAVDLDGNCATSPDSVSVLMTAGGTAQTIGVCVGGTSAFPAPGLGTVGYDLGYGPHVSAVPALWTINGTYFNGDSGAVAAVCAVNNTSSPDASIACNLPGALTGPTTSGRVATFAADICKTASGPVTNEGLIFGALFDLADTAGNAYDPVTLINGSISCTEPPPATATNTPTETPIPTNTPTPTATSSNPCEPFNPPTPLNSATPVTPDCRANVDKIPNKGNLFICDIGSGPFCDGNMHADPDDAPDVNGAGAFTFMEVAKNIWSTGSACENPVAPPPTPSNATPVGNCNGVVGNDGLGAYEFQIKFDHKIFNVAITDQGNLPNYYNPANCSFSVVTENYILFGCVSQGSAVDGKSGPGPWNLAKVVLTPNPDLKFRMTPGNDNGLFRPVLDENCELADIFGEPVWGTTGNGSTSPNGPISGPRGGLANTCSDAYITVRILEGDLNLDCEVDLSDAQSIAFRYGGIFGTLLYDPWFDLEPALKDFDVDIKDLQKVFGRFASNCWNPVPDQRPLDPPQGL